MCPNTLQRALQGMDCDRQSSKQGGWGCRMAQERALGELCPAATGWGQGGG